MKVFSFVTLLFFSSMAYVIIPAHAEIQGFLSEENKTALADFDLQDEIDDLTLRGDFVEATVNTDLRFIKSGKGSLRLLADNAKDGKPTGTPSFSMTVDPAIDLEDYRALGFWIYAPQETVIHFFGRNDVTVTIDGSKRFVKQWSPSPLRALSAGWSHYVWDFGELESLPKVNKITFAFSRLMETYKQAELYIDEVALYRTELFTTVNYSDLVETISKVPDWTKRYQAVKELRKSKTAEVLGAIIVATADESKLVRTTATEAMTDITAALGAKAAKQIQQAFGSDNWRIRQAVLECVVKFEDELGNLPQQLFAKALMDDCYYVRHIGFEKQLEKGATKESIAADMLKKLISVKDTKTRLACIRMIDHIGPQAKAAVPQLLEILRDKDEEFIMRGWSLRAVWWLNEEKLTAEDWAVGLVLEPGQIHRRLLDRVTDRLIIGAEKSLPVLKKKLKDKDPQIRARAAAILGHIGGGAADAVRSLKKARKDHKWYVQWEADTALGKIVDGYNPDKVGGAKKKKQKFEEVTSSTDGDMITISNGLVELVFENGNQSPGPVIVRKPGGENLVDGSWLPRICAFQYTKSPNFREKQWLQRLWGAPFPKKVETKIASITNDSADFLIKFSDDNSPLDWEFHYVVEKGQSGFYSYIVIRNISGEDMPQSHHTQSNTGVGRLNYLLALTWDHYDYSVLHDKFKGPGTQQPQPDNWNYLPKQSNIMNATERMPNGQVWAKHEWELYELDSPVTGYCGENGGFWLIHANRDYFHDSMPRWIKGGNYDHLFIPHLESKYNIVGGLTVHVDKDFEKVYGPMCFYLNDGDNVEEMWADAKRQANIEKASWPYKWLDLERYHDRGSVTGKLKIADGQSPEGAYIVLSNPVDKPADEWQIHLWMRNIGPYNYFTQVKPDGSFEIENIHQSSYDLFVFKPGMIGELRQDDVEITKGKATDVGQLVLKPHDKGKVLWQIGVPDGMAMEFKNGRNYHQWDNTERYAWDFPDDVHYVVGQSDWKTDWNYMQPVTVRGKWTPTTWTIDFDLEKIPDGKAVLMMVCAGAGADLDVIVNGNKVGDLKVNLGGQHGRSAPTGEITQREFEIDSNFLKPGKNQIQLTFAKGLATNPKAAERKLKKWLSPFIVYDFIRLEVR